MNLFNPPSVNYSSLKQGNRAYTTVKYNQFPANSYIYFSRVVNKRKDKLYNLFIDITLQTYRSNYIQTTKYERT